MSHKLEVAQAFDDGRESMAVDILEWLDDYADNEDIPVESVREAVEDFLGWSADE